MLPGFHSSRTMLVVAGTFRLEPVEKPMSNTVSQARLGKACPHILCGLLLAAGSEDPEVRAAEYWGRVLAGILNRHSLSSLWPSDFQSNIAFPPTPLEYPQESHARSLVPARAGANLLPSAYLAGKTRAGTVQMRLGDLHILTRTA